MLIALQVTIFFNLCKYHDSFLCSESCRDSCINHNSCTVYQFDPKTKKCSKCSFGIVEPSNTLNTLIESGWCPKVKDEIKKDLKSVSGTMTPEYWCQKDTTQTLANFPFRIEGESGLHYSPVKEQGVKKCTFKTFRTTTTNTVNRNDLKECSRCSGNISFYN